MTNKKIQNCKNIIIIALYKENPSLGKRQKLVFCKFPVTCQLLSKAEKMKAIYFEFINSNNIAQFALFMYTCKIYKLKLMSIAPK